MNKEIIERWKELGEYATMLPCPRCGHIKMEKELGHNALSRRVDLYVCPSCGTEEALEDYTGKKKPLGEWFLFSDLFGCKEETKEMPKGWLLDILQRLDEKNGRKGVDLDNFLENYVWDETWFIYLQAKKEGTLLREGEQK